MRCCHNTLTQRNTKTRRHTQTHTLTDTLHKDTHRDRANNNRNSSTQRCPQLILYACPLSSSHSLSLSWSLSLSHCLALCDVTSVELTYTWGFCETMFLNQIKIRNEHFTRHCICFAVNFTFPECSPSSPVPRLTSHSRALSTSSDSSLTHTHTNTHRSYAAVHLLPSRPLPSLSFKFY